MYEPKPFTDDSPLGRYLQEELRKLSEHLKVNEVENLEFKVWNTTPDKPRTGQAYYADGTNWNPGSGEGLYIYLSTSAWSKL